MPASREELAAFGLHFDTDEEVEQWRRDLSAQAEADEATMKMLREDPANVLRRMRDFHAERVRKLDAALARVAEVLRCNARRTNGKQCPYAALPGRDACKYHAGGIPKLR